jgi:para-nitrobenzyl esterase
MPSAKGLFHRAIIESGATLRLVEADQGTRVARELMTTLGIPKDRVRDLQSVPLDRMMSAYFEVVRRMNVDQMTQGFSPLVDGTVVPQHPFHPTASAVSADVPVMLGSTRTELTSSAQEADFSLTDAAMRGRVRQLLGSHADEAIQVYQKANPGATSSDIYFLIASDHRYSGPVMKIAERRAALGKGPVYLYYFRWETPVDGGRLKSPHTIEIPFAFDNIQAASRLTGGGAEAQALADRVSDAWIAFARTGNPNTPKLPQWPAFTAADRPTMVIDTHSRVERDPIKEQRLAMWEALGYLS